MSGTSSTAYVGVSGGYRATSLDAGAEGGVKLFDKTLTLGAKAGAGKAVDKASSQWIPYSLLGARVEYTPVPARVRLPVFPFVSASVSGVSFAKSGGSSYFASTPFEFGGETLGTAKIPFIGRLALSYDPLSPTPRGAEKGGQLGLNMFFGFFF